MFNGGSLNSFVGALGWWEGENKSQEAGKQSEALRYAATASALACCVITDDEPVWGKKKKKKKASGRGCQALEGDSLEPWRLLFFFFFFNMAELCRTASSLSGEPHGLELSFKKVFITKIRTNVSKDNLPFQERNTKQPGLSVSSSEFTEKEAHQPSWKPGRKPSSLQHLQVAEEQRKQFQKLVHWRKTGLLTSTN